MKFDIGDFVEAKDMISRQMVSGFIMWIQPGSGRIMIKGCGCLFRPEEVKRLWFDVDLEDLEKPEPSELAKKLMKSFKASTKKAVEEHIEGGRLPTKGEK